MASDPKKDQSPKRFSTIIDKVWETWKIGTQESPEKKISENWEKLVGLRLANKCYFQKDWIPEAVFFS